MILSLSAIFEIFLIVLVFILMVNIVRLQSKQCLLSELWKQIGAGAVNILNVLIIVFGTILISQIMRKRREIELISSSMSTISKERRIQVLIIAWFMGAFF